MQLSILKSLKVFGYCCHSDIDFTKTAFCQTLIHSQSLVKILWRSNKDKITFRAIEKHRYGLRETVSKHLKQARNLSNKR